MDPQLVRVSKFLSLVLRHDPGKIGLKLDATGWADVGELLAGAARAGVRLDRETLARVVAANEKQRFALSDDGTRIRANQGHSVEVDLGLEPRTPPEVLYHGTATRFIESIRRSGLHSAGRTHVHLSADEATARSVGQRHGRPVVLTVAAGRMHRDGRPFFRAANGVWLTDEVPPEYIGFGEGTADAG
ncbi:MAG TPA: RNA 2'-phosphotransferase [Longimicrobium sp.]|nr:RNA 2'-phosphotransferase [Longimicrobium sp.]